MKKYIIFFFLAFIISCSSGNKNNTTNADSQSAAKVENTNQFNITILLDLSDRIDTEKYPVKPEHFERDIANVKFITDLFVKDMESRGTFMAKGKMKVIFSPRLQDPNVNILAEKLNVDLSTMDNKQKKDIHDNMSSVFTENLSKIYELSISNHQWVGSDIWRFFKNDVKDYCVENNPEYRNILIILTDGYIYHDDSKDQAGNRFAYILPQIFTNYKLRNNPTWEQVIKDKDIGLITKRDDLQDLEVLVLEVTPSPNYKNDEDIIKVLLSKWFGEMNVKRYAIYNTDLPNYTQQRISDFLK